jgi:hypothetical protein
MTEAFVMCDYNVIVFEAITYVVSFVLGFHVEIQSCCLLLKVMS